MAKLSDTQARLDKKKYLTSETVGMDMSGNMDYCEGCRSRHLQSCTLSHEQRTKNNACARAYEHAKRGKKNG